MTDKPTYEQLERKVEGLMNEINLLVNQPDTLAAHGIRNQYRRDLLNQKEAISERNLTQEVIIDPVRWQRS